MCANFGDPGSNDCELGHFYMFAFIIIFIIIEIYLFAYNSKTT